VAVNYYLLQLGHNKLAGFIALNSGIALATLFRFWSYRRFVWVAPPATADGPTDGRAWPAGGPPPTAPHPHREGSHRHSWRRVGMRADMPSGHVPSHADTVMPSLKTLASLPRFQRGTGDPARSPTARNAPRARQPKLRDRSTRAPGRTALPSAARPATLWAMVRRPGSASRRAGLAVEDRPLGSADHRVLSPCPDPPAGARRNRWAFWRSPPAQPGWARPALLAIAAAAAALYARNLPGAGFAPFYSTAVKKCRSAGRRSFTEHSIRRRRYRWWRRCSGTAWKTAPSPCAWCWPRTAGNGR
jgi:hypothetical protein